jgi:hypothetical protein
MHHDTTSQREGAQPSRRQCCAITAQLQKHCKKPKTRGNRDSGGLQRQEPAVLAVRTHSIARTLDRTHQGRQAARDTHSSHKPPRITRKLRGIKPRGAGTPANTASMCGSTYMPRVDLDKDSRDCASR